jgi:AbrB family looped-hinge helix DNA binding protein
LRQRKDRFILIAMKVAERGQLTIPKAIREGCGFTPNTEVEVRIREGAVVVEPKRDRRSPVRRSNDSGGVCASRCSPMDMPPRES